MMISTLEKYRRYAISAPEQGPRFESLMQAFLLTDPTYADRFQQVWLWKDFPLRDQFGLSPTQIDLVALTTAGDYWAIHCRLTPADATVSPAVLKTFLDASGQTFQDPSSKTHTFAQRLWISTADNPWTPATDQQVQGLTPPFIRIGLSQLEQAPVEWDKLEQGITGTQARSAHKVAREHQLTVLEKAHDHFKTHDRGKLIMACGTGKTLTALWIAEQETQGQGLVLFLVPSIALLSQTLREWSANSKQPIHTICICSDAKVSSKSQQDRDTARSSLVDLALPASTDAASILKQLQHARTKPGMTVVISTYQSIDVISKAQKKYSEAEPARAIFDLVICDEAHRTTGTTLASEDESAFVKVHQDNHIHAHKRLYMTATPRLYSDDSKAKAAESDTILCSMDDEQIYGPEIYRIGFGEAVDKGLLTDYKVLVLTMSDRDVPPAIQEVISNKSSEIAMADMPKLIGCINALSKQILGDQGTIYAADPEPMRRAVAFCPSIKESQKTSRIFNSTTEIYRDGLSQEQRKEVVSLSTQYIDGSMNAPQRDRLLNWLKEDSTHPNECRILTNVRCLSEGVDVPSLDAILFLSARSSQVDVVQSVGRVMRLAPGKKYGYIIIPVVIPSDMEPDLALNDNKRFGVVWDVLNALRAHDDRFNAIVNKIELNKLRPEKINVVGPALTAHIPSDPSTHDKATQRIGHQLQFQFEQLQPIIFARIVKKVGRKDYWEQWSKTVAEIATLHFSRIKSLVTRDEKYKVAFKNFLKGLQHNMNPSISENEAIEMLSQHIITKPVFDALFKGYSFVENNPISKAMQCMIDILEAQALEKDTLILNKFYESVRNNAEGIDNLEGKQRIIIRLYDQFFKTAFPKMVEKLGIVYTPLEVVDFIIHSVEFMLKKEFSRSLADENVHILDPFTGTGTFITRLLQSGCIPQERLAYKYKNEIHANELVLLAYYIAAINIENAYHDIMDKAHYSSFEGICLTDTFQLSEKGESPTIFKDFSPQNSERVEKQKHAPLKVIIGNPPYSVGQRNANDNAQNQTYPKLNDRIASTYVRESRATNKNSLYDSYIKAIRWSSDRLDAKHGGIICFVSNGSWIEGNAQDGLRKCLEKEFNSIYIFNLRGNARSQGEFRRKEAGNVFGAGTRTTITITLLIKSPNAPRRDAAIYYRDIGDYLNQTQKLSIVAKLHSMGSEKMNWTKLIPNEHGDWLNLRTDNSEEMISLGSKDDSTSSSFFYPIYSGGLKSNRDAWCYNTSSEELKRNMHLTLSFLDEQKGAFQIAKRENPSKEVDEFLIYDSTKISWSLGFKQIVQKGKNLLFSIQSLRIALYRPFFKQQLYFARDVNDAVYLLPKLFPSNHLPNKVICVPGIGATKDFTCLITDTIPDLGFVGASQCFPLYYYEKHPKSQLDLFKEKDEDNYIRHDAITDWILAQAQQTYTTPVTKEDIFYYVYGFLHHPTYRETYANDLKKMLPRLPLVESEDHFWKFSKAGRDLADLHIDYESVPHCQEVNVTYAESPHFKVEKMRFPKKGQKDTIIYNSTIRIENIPLRAYDYVVNGKSAIEWVMDRYRPTTHQESGIRNDPNDWATETNNPRYILDLLLSIIELSLRTIDIVQTISEIKDCFPKQPEAVISPFAPLPAPHECYTTHLPLLPTRLALGVFKEPQFQLSETWEWIQVPKRNWRKGMFVVQMEDQTATNQSPSVFSQDTYGSYDGRLILVEIHEGSTWRYKYVQLLTQRSDTYELQRIILKPLDPDAEPIIIEDPEAMEFSIIAERVIAA